MIEKEDQIQAFPATDRFPVAFPLLREGARKVRGENTAGRRYSAPGVLNGRKLWTSNCLTLL